MNRILNSGAGWAAGLCLCMGAAAQTPLATNTDSGQGSLATDTNAYAYTPITNASWPTYTNLPPSSYNLTNLLEATPSVPPLLYPYTLGSDQIASPLLGTRAISVPGGPTGAGAPLGPGIPIWGPILFHPSLSYQFADTTGLQSQPGQRQDTVVQTFSAGLLFILGSQWALDYAPSYSIYSGNNYGNTFENSLALSGRFTYEDWAFNLSQSYSSTSQLLVETGTQTRQDAYVTSIGAAYQMSSRLSLQLGADQTIRDTTQFNNVDTWSGTVGLNYAATERLRFGMNFGAGYNDISVGSSMPYESAQGVISWQPGEKLSLFVSGGAEDLQFVHPTAPNLVTPIFTAAANYQLFPTTSLSVSGSRSVNPSYFANQVQVTTSVGGSVRQQLSKKWSLSLNAGYTSEPLTSIVPQPLPKFFLGAPPTAFLVQDEAINSTVEGVNLNYAVLERVNLTAYVTFNQNSATQSNFRYSSTQIGFSVNYSY